MELELAVSLEAEFGKNSLQLYEFDAYSLADKKWVWSQSLELGRIFIKSKMVGVSFEGRLSRIRDLIVSDWPSYKMLMRKDYVNKTSNFSGGKPENGVTLEFFLLPLHTLNAMIDDSRLSFKMFHETGNRYDSNARNILTTGTKKSLGYLPADLALFISRLEEYGLEGGICFWNPRGHVNLELSLVYFLENFVDMLKATEEKEQTEFEKPEFLSLRKLRRTLEVK